ncbi:hypothetical protein M8J76_008978 [Diaphorina citri]|nr:hypothetical protein M8J76_008978 [Diaphorina citri]
MKQNTKTKEMFIIRALEKILKDKDVRRKDNAELKKACESALGEIKKELKDDEKNEETSYALPLPKDNAELSTNIAAEKYFEPFELACKSKSAKIIVTSLDCIQKLIAYGHLTGNVVDPKHEDKLLIDRIVETICKCFTGEYTDENVQLQIIKALLTVVTSQQVEVHGSTILLAVKTCYDINIASKNLINQTTARATLTQMLNVIFSRMESQAAYEEDVRNKQNIAHTNTKSDSVIPPPPQYTPPKEAREDPPPNGLTNEEAGLSQDTPPNTNQAQEDPPSTNQNQEEHTPSQLTNEEAERSQDTPSSVSTNEREGLSQDTPTELANERRESGEISSEEVARELVDSVISTAVEKCEENQSTPDSTPNGSIPHQNTPNTTLSDQTITPAMEHLEPTTPRSSVDLGLTSPGAEYTGCMSVSTSAPSVTSETPTVENMSEILETHSTHNSSLGRVNSQESIETNSVAQFSHILQKDAFIVFRSMCRLSMKPLTQETPDPKSCELRSKILSLHLLLSILQSAGPVSCELRSKILSLHLLLSILQSAGPVFRSNSMFIAAIKQYLCVALSKNGVSPVPEVFELSLSIFLALLDKFKAHLKIQIEVFFKEIFLNILETSTSSFQHKWIVIQALIRFCADAQSVVDMYVNYDCDLSAANLFERLVKDLSKIAQGRQALELGATPEQEKCMRTCGLECLVSVLKCMVEWSKDLYVNPNLQTNLYLGAERNVREPESNPDSHLVSPRDPTIRSFGGSATSLASGESGGNRESPDTPHQLQVLKHQKEVWETGIQTFNQKPNKGIQFLQEQGLLGSTPGEVAEWLHLDDRLDKTRIGDFLGEHDDFNKEPHVVHDVRLVFALV